jgi:hypothetical protein
LPQMSYCGFLAPITPATTGPMLIPETCISSYFIPVPIQRNCISFVSFMYYTNPYQRKKKRKIVITTIKYNPTLLSQLQVLMLFLLSITRCSLYILTF